MPVPWVRDRTDGDLIKGQVVIEDTIREFLISHLGVRMAASELGDDRSLLASGLIDSLAVLDIIEFVEQRFGITLEPEDLTGDNFDSVGAIAGLARSRGA